jgi:ATP-binding cassette, subfamily B, bacterial HlyB/CyaB
MSPRTDQQPVSEHDGGLRALCGIAAYYGIAAEPSMLQRELALGGRRADVVEVLRAAKRLGLKAREVSVHDERRLASLPSPAIARLIDGSFSIFAGRLPTGLFRFIDPLTGADRVIGWADFGDTLQPVLIVLARKAIGPGVDPRVAGFRWFWPSIWRYRKPLGMVLVASLFIQVFALVTPLFFQVIIDKVLTHKGYATLFVLVGGVALIGFFDVVLQYLRTYVLSHTTNRIDAELGQRLFSHLLRLPMSYFETRAAGQTVARIRELENIRAFLTGQGLFCALDVVFTFVAISVLFAYSFGLTFIVIAAIPVYMVIALVIRPVLAKRVQDKFYRGALSQQFLVESVVGIQTLKAAAVEPVVRAEWEEKLASYIQSSFGVTLTGAGGQNLVQYVSRVTTALLMLFGAKAVIDGDLTVGSLIAFNMIAAQVTQPILRLSQFAQDFQQVQVSVQRLGDILNAPSEPSSERNAIQPPPKGLIEFKNITFRYKPGSPDILKGVSLRIEPGEVVGIVGPSGSGKSTLTKLIQRLYTPQEGQVLLDGSDLNHLDPLWLRGNIGVVLQENILFNRTIRENITLASPGLPDARVVAISKLAGADEFIARMPNGYDTHIEERGSNLSGGQRQRIAIARALATNPPILILDEATSALDYESELVIHRNMRQIVANRTVIIVAHRLAAVRHCDRIIAMEDGRIVENGPPADLLSRPGGLYRKLWELQSEGAQA